MNKIAHYSKIAVISSVLMVMFFLSAVSVSWGAPYFSDNMEGEAKWTGEIPWVTTTSEYHSASTAWTDSADSYYANQADVSLTLSTAVDLTSATNPQLVFRHKYEIETDFDYGYLELSIDGGGTWPVTLASFTGISDWRREQIDISAYAGQADVKIRFRLETDKSIVWDGWYVDDVVISEPPNAVASLTVDNPTGTSLELSWLQNLDADFAGYKIYRSVVAGVNTNSDMVATITDSTTTSYVDSSLGLGTTYYYKVYVFNADDVYAAGKEESRAIPETEYIFFFSDDMEGGAGDWIPTSPWALDTGTDHTTGEGSFWSDSPGGANYENDVNKALTIQINLGGAIRPILRFWQRYNIENYEDYGFVEISTDEGSTWTNIYSVTGFTLTNWEEAAIDLTSWTNQRIQLRFRLDANTNGFQYDGWEIDDVSITENPAGMTEYPFIESFDTDSALTGNWITTGKGQEFLWVAGDGHNAAGSVYFYPMQNTSYYHKHTLVMARPIDLSGTVNPQLSFWHKYRFLSGYTEAGVDISTDGGHTWNRISPEYRGNSTVSTWTRVQVDLSSYTDLSIYTGLAQVLIRFHLQGRYDEYDDAYWQIDDVRIGADESIQKMSGDTQVGQTGAALSEPFVAMVHDPDNLPKAGIPVTFEVTSGNGSLSVVNAVSDASGQVSSILTLGPDTGTNTVTATVDGYA